MSIASTTATITFDRAAAITLTTLPRTALAAGVASAPFLIVTDLLDGLSRPGYSVLRHWVSHRALGEYGWLGTGSIVLTAILLGFGAFGLLVVRRGARVGSLQPLFVTIAAAALLLAGVFTMDPSLGYPPGTSEPTVSFAGAVHQVAGPVFMISLAVAAILTRRFLARIDLPAAWARAGWVVGVLIVIAFAVCSTLVSLDYAEVVPSAWSGLFERATIYIGLSWSSAVCAHILRATRALRATRPSTRTSSETAHDRVAQEASLLFVRRIF